MNYCKIKKFFLLERWEQHPFVEIVRWIQARNRTGNDKPFSAIDSSSEEEEEEEDNASAGDKEENLENDDNEEESNDEESSSDVDEPKVSASSNKFGLLADD